MQDMNAWLYFNAGNGEVKLLSKEDLEKLQDNLDQLKIAIYLRYKKAFKNIPVQDAWLWKRQEIHAQCQEYLKQIDVIKHLASLYLSGALPKEGEVSLV